jgi:hypothetical protein
MCPGQQETWSKILRILVITSPYDGGERSRENLMVHQWIEAVTNSGLGAWGIVVAALGAVGITIARKGNAS